MANRNNLAVVSNDRQARFDEYADLLIRRDQLFKAAGSYRTAYTQEFGDLICDNFSLKIECIKKKKTIAYCYKCLNRGQKIDAARMQAEIEEEMKTYNMQLKEMLANTKNAKDAQSVGEFKFNRAKKLYRRLAKLIHPDINKLTMKDPTLKELWMRITEAYRRNDADELDDLEVMVRIALEDMDAKDTMPDYPDIEDRIARIERQISDIISTEPYTYGEILESEEKTAEHRERLQAEHKEYETYLELLTKTLDDMLRDGGVKLIWKMN